MSTIALAVDHLTEFNQSLEAKIGKDWLKQFPEGKSLMKGMVCQCVMLRVECTMIRVE